MSVCLYYYLSHSAHKSHLTRYVLCCRLRPTWFCQIISTFSQKGHDFRKYEINNSVDGFLWDLILGTIKKSDNWIWNMGFYFLWNCEIFLVHWIIHWYTLMDIYGSFILYPLFLSYLHERVFLTDFRKVLKCEFHENPYVGSRVVPCGQTDITKLVVAFRNFVKGE